MELWLFLTTVAQAATILRVVHPAVTFPCSFLAADVLNLASWLSLFEFCLSLPMFWQLHITQHPRPLLPVEQVAPHLFLPGLCSSAGLLPAWAVGPPVYPTDLTGLFPFQTWALGPWLAASVSLLCFCPLLPAPCFFSLCISLTSLYTHLHSPTPVLPIPRNSHPLLLGAVSPCAPPPRIWDPLCLWEPWGPSIPQPPT